MLDEPEAWDEFYELFKAVAIEVEAYFAYVTPIDLTNQFRGTGLPYLELSDVEWINWYGPALLEHWGGAERLDGVGFRQEQAANGSLAVWATEDPPELDPSLTGRANYRWKWPFYGAVGRDTFYKPDPNERVRTWEDQMALVGVHVPSPEAQRRYARQWGEPA